MATLHLHRSARDATTEALMNTLPEDPTDKMIELYSDNMDWESVIDDIFSYDNVICWW